MPRSWPRRGRKVPPHPRGWSLRRRKIVERPMGSPAPAGMVPPPRHRGCPRPRFPRTRGDGPCYDRFCGADRAVPPHPRGWSVREAREAAKVAGSPAPAGMVLMCAGRWRTSNRFPRTRGDGPRAKFSMTRAFTVPPHPRGWSLVPEPVFVPVQGSPAPAPTFTVARQEKPSHASAPEYRPASGCGRRSSLPPNQYAHRWIFSRRPGPCLLQGSAGP